MPSNTNRRLSFFWGEGEYSQDEITEDHHAIRQTIQAFLWRQRELERKEDAFHENTLHSTLKESRQDGLESMKSALQQQQRPDSPRPDTVIVGWSQQMNSQQRLGRKRMSLLSKNLRLLRKDFFWKSLQHEDGSDDESVDIEEHYIQTESMKKCQKRLSSLSLILLSLLGLASFALYIEAVKCSGYQLYFPEGIPARQESASYANNHRTISHDSSAVDTKRFLGPDTTKERSRSLTTACGESTCQEDEFCCNESCGICAPLDGVCIQMECGGEGAE